MGSYWYNSIEKSIIHYINVFEPDHNDNEVINENIVDFTDDNALNYEILKKSLPGINFSPNM